MKFLEVAKEGNKIRRKNWISSDYYLVKDNEFYFNGKILNGGVAVCANDWEIYDDIVELGDIKCGLEFKFTDSCSNYIRLNPCCSLEDKYPDQSFIMSLPDNTLYYMPNKTKVIPNETDTKNKNG